MSKFKVGDRVSNIDTSRNGTVAHVNSLGLIVKMDEPGSGINISNHGGFCNALWLREDEWRLIAPAIFNRKIVIASDGVTTFARLYDGKAVVKSAEAKCSPTDTFDFNFGAKLAVERLLEEDKPEPHKYKAGDKVKVIADTCSHRQKIGTVLTLTEPYKAIVEKLNPAWRFEEDVAFISERDFEPFVEPEKPKYYNGKVVCVSNRYFNLSSCVGFTVGKIYDVKDGLIVSDRDYKSQRYCSLKSLCTGLGNEFIPLVED